MAYLLFITYILFSATGLLLLRSGAGEFTIALQSGGFLNFSVSFRMLAGMFFYVCSFLLFMILLPRFNLTYLYPISAGVLYVVIIISGVVFLRERLPITHIIGIVLVFSGVVMLNLQR